jgi:hypothetical protein
MEPPAGIRHFGEQTIKHRRAIKHRQVRLRLGHVEAAALRTQQRADAFEVLARERLTRDSSLNPIRPFALTKTGIRAPFSVTDLGNQL